LSLCTSAAFIVAQRLPRALPVLAKLVATEYRRALHASPPGAAAAHDQQSTASAVIGASCPMCMFNSVHQEQCASLAPHLLKMFPRWE
jgi:hypothetical protein